MKTLIVLIPVLLFGKLLLAQDVIVKKNGDEIESKILEITTETIKYKEFTFQDGPIRNIKISDVFMIIYENGKREVLNKSLSIAKIDNIVDEDSAENKYNFGVEVGPTLRHITGTSDFMANSRISMGYLGGMHCQFNITNAFSIKTGVYFERKGRSFTENRSDNNGFNYILKGNLHFEYITIPVLVKIAFGNKKRIFFNAGPYFGYLIKMKGNVGGQGFVRTDYYERQDFGLSTGIGINVPISEKLILSVEGRNSIGFMDVEPSDNSIARLISNCIILGISYGF